MTSTVDAILADKKVPESGWKSDQANITVQQAALTRLQGEVGTIETSFQALNDMSGAFSGVNATSSNTTAMTATAMTGAVSGTHTITIGNLATTGVSYSNGVTSASSTITAGALVFKRGTGTAQTINIPGDSTTVGGVTTTATTTTLAAAAAYINKQNAGITASIITDSAGARLALSSTASGAAASVSVQTAPTELTFNDVAGVDANLTVDGVPVTSSSNKLSTAVSGVTLNLVGTSGSEITVSVGPDTAKITAAVKSLVTAFNEAIKDLNTQFQVIGGATNTSNTAGVLETDPAARSIQQSLLSSISVVSGDNATFRTLGSLGISMANDGTLSLDTTKFASALDSNYSDVQSFFQSTDTASFASSFSTTMSQLTDSTDSSIVLDLTSLKNSYTADQKNIDDLEANLVNLRASLVSKYSALDALLKTFPSTLDQINTQLGYNTKSTS